MTIAIGTSVLAADFGAGFVVHEAGAPGGGHLYSVRSRDGERTGRFRTAELAPGTPAPEFEVGATVTLFGAPAHILARSGDAYAVEVVRRRLSGLVFHHLYPAVPAWVLALGYA